MSKSAQEFNCHLPVASSIASVQGPKVYDRLEVATVQHTDFWLHKHLLDRVNRCSSYYSEQLTLRQLLHTVLSKERDALNTHWKGGSVQFHRHPLSHSASVITILNRWLQCIRVRWQSTRS